MFYDRMCKWRAWFTKGKAKDQLSALLNQARKEHTLDPEVAMMMESVLKLSQKKVRDVMIPRANMKVILHTDSHQKALTKVLNAKHSRYPVICDTKDEVIGLLLAKSLLLYQQSEQTPPQDMAALCMPATFVPESQRLDSLLKEFKKNHTHMAIVMDEYGGVSGLITLEDVIEEITGEIEDEDFHEDQQQTIKQLSQREYLISGLATLSEVNEALETTLSSEVVDTFGGYIAQQLGTFPKPKQTIEINELSCKIEHADARRIRYVKVSLNATTENTPDTT